VRIDLHTHSTLSDGSLTPEELVDKAVSKNIKVLALCDHDTTGDDRFESYASKKGIKAIQGIEVSCEWLKGTCHILGIGVKRGHKPLEDILSNMISSRDNRNSMIVDKLVEQGIDITLDEVLKVAGDGTVGRPHIARVLIDKGYVKTTQEAFDTLLAKGGPCYIKRYRPEPDEAIRALKGAGAKPVIAHPTQLKRTFQDLDIILGNLKEQGLWGVEVYTPYTPTSHIGSYLALLDKHGLGLTAGSDFHGDPKPNHFLGELRNGVPIIDSMTSLLKD
jgi:predicted metal-dependent phosphoesterase TrpH